MPLELLLNETVLNLGKAAITIYASANVGTMLQSKFRLQKLSKYNNKIIVDMPPRVKPLSKDEIEKIEKDSGQAKAKLLLPAIQKLKENISEKNLKIFYTNLKTAKFKKNHLLLLCGFSGYYYGDTNTLKYALDSSFGHELLHLSSAVYDKENEIGLSGFMQFKGSTSIGAGINEGYTELLASRYFNKDGKPRAYHLQVKLAQIMELMFDNPAEMHDLYFNCNLPGLVHHLEKYAPKEEVIKLILDMDKINVYSSSFGPLPTILYIKTQLKLYEWFVSKNKDNDKLKTFNELINGNIFVKNLINNKKYKLYQSPYIQNTNEENKRTL